MIQNEKTEVAKSPSNKQNGITVIAKIYSKKIVAKNVHPMMQRSTLLVWYKITERLQQKILQNDAKSHNVCSRNFLQMMQNHTTLWCKIAERL